MYTWPERKKLRKKNHDYSSSWYYFVTICTKNREYYFWEIIDWKIILNEYGNIVLNEILKTEELRKEIKIDEFVIMPNHLHLIVIIDQDECKERLQSFPTNNMKYTTGEFDWKGAIWLRGNNLSSVIRWLKWSITNIIRKNYDDYDFGWHKSYFDKIIKTEDQFIKTQDYILNNPINWKDDVNNKESVNFQEIKK